MRKLKLNTKHLRLLATKVVYNPTTGSLTWCCDIPPTNSKRADSAIKAGDAVHLSPHGAIRFKGDETSAAVVAWYIQTGVIPVIPVQRINGLARDLRFINLIYLPDARDLTQEQLMLACNLKDGELIYRYPDNHRRRLKVIKRGRDHFISLFGHIYRKNELVYLYEKGRWPEAGEVGRVVKGIQGIRFNGISYMARINVLGRNFRLGSYRTLKEATTAISYAMMIRAQLPEYGENNVYAQRGVPLERRREVWDWYQDKISN